MAFIYGYYSYVDERIVYVGQTKDITTRHKTHIKYDPYIKTKREYNYPLSRGIRKYGVENYELVILKEVEIHELDNEEIYYIKLYNTYYNGYNQTKGGKQYTTSHIYSDEVVDKIIDLLANSNLTMTHISEITGVSLTHIHNINYGTRRQIQGMSYPIRPKEVNRENKKHYGNSSAKRKLTNKDVYEIYDLLKYTNFTFSEIGNMYGVGQTQITALNKGIVRKQAKVEYPIRKTKFMH